MMISQSRPRTSSLKRKTLSSTRFAEYRRFVATRWRAAGPSSKDRESNVAGFAKPAANPRHRSIGELVGTFWSLLGRHQGAMLFSLGVLTVSVIAGLVPLYIPKIIVDSVLGGKPLEPALAGILPSSPYSLMSVLVGVFVGLFLVSESLSLWARWHAARVRSRLQADVRGKAFEHACQLPLHRVNELKTGGVVSLLREDAGAVGDLVTRGLFHPWKALVQLTGSLVILVWVDWRLLLIGIFAVPIGWATHRTWVKRIRPLWRDVHFTRQETDSLATETFGGMRIVRAFGRRRAEKAEFVRRLHLMVRQELYAWWWMRGVDSAWSMAVPFGTATLLSLGAWRILADQTAVEAGKLAAQEAFTSGDLVAFLTFLAALLGPVSTLAATATQLQSSLAGLDRTLDLFEEQIETEQTGNGGGVSSRHVVLDDVKGEITLHDVAFRYPNNSQHAISHINLKITAGTVTAFVGASGSGKSTLCNLIARFYIPTEGSITLDGINFREIQLDSYRRLLGIVDQDIFLFDGTIAENIGYGRYLGDEEDIYRAAELANADEFIRRLPNGYQSLVGERGVRLSGGQRQRLAIARAILADPKILILDEATSALDTESERLIQDSFAKLMANRTCLVIAHRLSTITHADKIVVMDRGRIIETGTHAQLMEQSQLYRRMIQLQISGVDQVPNSSTDEADKPMPRTPRNFDRRKRSRRTQDKKVTTNFDAESPARKRLSVIVPVYNAEATLPECLESLTNQSIPANQYEILAVDNNSSDNSAEIVRQYPCVRLLAEQEQSSYAARNRAIREAEGRILAFTDPDCVACRDWLEQIEMAFTDSQTQIVLGPADANHSAISLRMLSWYERAKDAFVFGSSDPMLYYGHTNNMAVRREAFDTLGNFQVRKRGADTVFVRQTVDRFGCESVRYLPAVQVRHLEVDQVKTYFRKVSTYGRSCRRYRQVVPARPLKISERLRVFRTLIDTERLTPTAAAHLLLLLFLGMLFWVFGSFSVFNRPTVSAEDG